VDVRLRVEMYPDDPRPCVEDTKFIEVFVRIPWTVDVRLRVEMYPDDPRPCVEDTRFIEVFVRIP
jgi:adenylylsulfate kinase-like enzyme